MTRTIVSTTLLNATKFLTIQYAKLCLLREYIKFCTKLEFRSCFDGFEDFYQIYESRGHESRQMPPALETLSGYYELLRQTLVASGEHMSVAGHVLACQ